MPPTKPRSAVLIHGPSLPVYDLGQDHPFARHRQQALFDLITRMDMAEPEELLRAEQLGEAGLELAHSPEYIAQVQAISVDSPSAQTLAQAMAFGLGTADNPIGKNQHASAGAMAAATRECVLQVMRGKAEHAFNPAGGLHHATRGAASGFCIYNDLVVGIRTAQQEGAQKVLYVDFDVHHGDGVEFAFQEDPSVCTLSFHQDPDTLFPGTGRLHDRGHAAGKGSVVNMPLAPYTGDASWWETVSTVLPKVARAFRPDFILSQHGCDPHFSDPLAQLQLTTKPMMQAAQLSKDLAKELCGGRWVGTGGGGYQPLTVIPRVWSMVWLVMSGRDIPVDLDPAWVEHWQKESAEAMPRQFFDAELDEDKRQQRAAEHNQANLSKLLSLLDQA